MAHKYRKFWLDPVGYCLDSKHDFLRSIGQGAYERQTRRYEDCGAQNSDKKITVIMTVFNTGQLVQAAIESVLAQTHQNFELMVIDDASTDDTLDIVTGIAATDARIKVFHSPQNHGTYWSKNWCLARATSDFVAFHDSDDVSAPSRLQTQLGALVSRKNTVSTTCRWRRVDEAGKLLTVNGMAARTAIISLMIRRAVVVGRIGFFDTVRIAADLDFVSRIQQVFGRRRHKSMRQTLYTGLLRDGSLTRSGDGGYNWQVEGTEVSKQLNSGARADYHAASARWLADNRVSPDLLYMEFPLEKRHFSAAEAICRGCDDMDVAQVREMSATGT
ncbi:MAG: glycosyltransferase family 2 protein [Kordiimonadaceae bacterium]|nr:glycosyltransferase family 2 protein [Kordiimonadaceae bacterium]